MDEELYKFARRRKLLKCDEEVIEYIFNGEDIPFPLWSKKTYPRSVNVFCEINCIACGEKSRATTKHLAKRTLLKEEVCLKCGNAEVRKKDEWLKINSEAQKKVQSTPEQKLKNSLAVKKFWKENPEKKELVRQKLLSYYEDPAYKKMVAEARTKNLHALSGKFKFRNERWVEFGSSYELCFLMWLEDQEGVSQIRKCKFYIEYNHKNRLRFYYPDFLLVKNGKRIIVELKSRKTPFFDELKNQAKIVATEKFIKEMNYDGYWFIDEEEADCVGLKFKRSARIKPICKVLHKENRIKLFSKEKELRYIGRID